MNIEDFCKINYLDCNEHKVEALLQVFSCNLNHIFDGEPLDGDQVEDVVELVREYLNEWNGNNE
jgi:hypothetical protein